MGKYLALVAVLFAIGVGLALSGSTSSSLFPEKKLNVALKPPPRDAIQRRLSYCDSDDDVLVMSVTDLNDVQVAKSTICSSYGEASARTFQDGAGKNYVFLTHMEGRGTRATTTFLSIYRVSTNDLHFVLKTPIEWVVGFRNDFIYSYGVKSLRNRGLEVTFKGAVQGDPEEQDLCCIPPEKSRVIRILEN